MNRDGLTRSSAVLVVIILVIVILELVQAPKATSNTLGYCRRRRICGKVAVGSVAPAPQRTDSPIAAVAIQQHHDSHLGHDQER
jgi:hypothetical protein